MEHTKHLWRAGLILVVLFVGYVVWRHFMIPESFGLEGHYRYDSLLEFMDQEPAHGSVRACAACHEEAQTKRDQSKHVSVSCETCHAPLSVHVKDGEKVAEMPVANPLELCVLCHLKLRARPAGFPQVDLLEHLADAGFEMDATKPLSPNVCKLCHHPHDPSKR